MKNSYKLSLNNSIFFKTTGKDKLFFGIFKVFF